MEKTDHTIFFHQLPKGGAVPEHTHENNVEMFICLEGEGIISIDEEIYQFKKHDVAYVAPLSIHSIQATKTDMKFMVIITPTGLEERLKLMGIAKKANNEFAPEKFESQN